MPIIVACPSCQGKLRVADELREQMVRCPTCSVTFFPASGSSSPPPPPPPSQWQDPSAPLEPEVLDSEDSSPDSDRPRLPDDDEDLRSCPQCGRLLHRSSSRCFHCGQSTGRRRSLVRQSRRRDLDPDRGALVLTLGVLSLVAITLCAPVGIVLGLASWIMGHSDLRRMREKTMDDEGRSMTHAGWICGIIGTLLNLLLSLACLGCWVAIMAGSFTPVQTTRTSPVFSPPAQRPAPPPATRPPNRNRR